MPEDPLLEVSLHVCSGLESIIIIIILALYLYIDQDYYSIGNITVTNGGDGTPSTSAGIYILTQEIPYKGTLKSIEACGFVVDTITEKSGDSSEITMFFFITAYRQVGKSYSQVFPYYRFSYKIGSNQRFGCGDSDMPGLNKNKLPSNLIVSTGDKIGVLIQDGKCISKGSVSCPAHINLYFDPTTNTSQVEYYDQYMDNIGKPLERLRIQDGNPENNISINIQVTIGMLTQ